MSGTTLEPEERIIVDLIQSKGPLTGFEIKQLVDIESLVMWKTCRASSHLTIRTVGRKYLRFDRHVPGLARLSPSILREFFTYSVVGLAKDPETLYSKCVDVKDRIAEISRYKLELGTRTFREVMSEFYSAESSGHRICFLIAGDVVYGMAHDVPRPERSTGKLVKGSDIDLVIIADDDVPETSLEHLDRIVFQKKYRMLRDPSVNEELDYKIKPLRIVREQVSFDTFGRMVAIKILNEGLLVGGDESLFQAVKTIIHQNGLDEKLNALEEAAIVTRMHAENSILANSINEEDIRTTHLFYSAEEFEEFE